MSTNSYLCTSQIVYYLYLGPACLKGIFLQLSWVARFHYFYVYSRASCSRCNVTLPYSQSKRLCHILTITCVYGGHFNLISTPIPFLIASHLSHIVYLIPRNVGLITLLMTNVFHSMRNYSHTINNFFALILFLCTY